MGVAIFTPVELQSLQLPLSISLDLRNPSSPNQHSCSPSPLASSNKRHSFCLYQDIVIAFGNYKKHFHTYLASNIISVVLITQTTLIFYCQITDPTTFNCFVCHIFEINFFSSCQDFLKLQYLRPVSEKICRRAIICMP